MNNPQAFPRNELKYTGGGFAATDGMSLRDYMAGQALASVAANDKFTDGDDVGSWCYKQADAMLKAREVSE